VFVVIEKGRELRRRDPQRLLGFGLLWLLSQVVTDVVRDSAPEDFLRGWAKIGFTLVNFAALYLLLENDRRLLLFGAGLAGGQLVKYFVNPGVLAHADPWKFGLSYPVTLFLVLASVFLSNRGWPLLGGSLTLAASILNLSFNFRSLALICFLAWVPTFLIDRFRKRQLRSGHVVVLALGVAAALLVFSRVYVVAANAGLMGDDARQKYDEQSAGDLGLLLGGRNESLASLRAVWDSPIIGHGSWAKDPFYANLLYEQVALHGYINSGQLESDLIPTHSHIIGAWVEAGIMGGLFWFAVLLVVLRSLWSCLKSRSKSAVLVLFCGISLLWDIPFSPYGSNGTFAETYSIVIVMGLGVRRKILHRAALRNSPAPTDVNAIAFYDYRHSNAIIQSGTVS
jgi:O-antigen ligase